MNHDGYRRRNHVEDELVWRPETIGEHSANQDCEALLDCDCDLGRGLERTRSNDDRDRVTQRLVSALRLAAQ